MADKNELPKWFLETNHGEKLLPLQMLAKRLHWERENYGSSIVTTNGCFDILHCGHLYLLEACKDMGDILVVLINADRRVRELKGHDRPINKASDRASLVLALKPVDYIAIFDEDTPSCALDLLRPDVHVKGGDYDRDKLPEIPVVERNGGEVIIVPSAIEYSTTELVRKIRS